MKLVSKISVCKWKFLSCQVSSIDQLFFIRILQWMGELGSNEEWWCQLFDSVAFSECVALYGMSQLYLAVPLRLSVAHFAHFESLRLSQSLYLSLLRLNSLWLSAWDSNESLYLWRHVSFMCWVTIWFTYVHCNRIRWSVFGTSSSSHIPIF